MEGCFGEGCGHLFAPVAPYCASAQCLLCQQPLAPFPCLTYFCPSFFSSPHFLRCTLMLLPRGGSFPLSLTQALCPPHSSPPRSRHPSSCLLLPLEDLLLGSQLLCLILSFSQLTRGLCSLALQPWPVLWTQDHIGSEWGRFHTHPFLCFFTVY